MFCNMFASRTFVKVCMYLSCLAGLGIASLINAEVISSFFGVTREKDIERNSLEVASFTRETQVLNCALSCLREKNCSLSSFNGKDIGACLLYRKSNSSELEDSSLRSPDFTHFKKLGEYDPQKKRFMNDPDLDDGSISAFKQSKSEPTSCADINNKTNGIYSIKLPDDKYAQVYCIMENITGCDNGGWALAMKINGYKSTFTFESSYWTNTQTLNYPTNMASLDDEEMKSPIFSEMKASKICIGMKQGNETRWLQIQLNVNSLRSLFASGKPYGTNLGKSSWKNLIKGSSVQEVCSVEGINRVTGKPGSVLKIRLGLIGSGKPCNAPKSFIGFGSSIIASSGNVIVGQHEIKTFGYILVK